MKNTNLQSLLAAALVAVTVCAPAQSFLDVVDADLDALREGREQNTAPANVRAIFAKAKAAADEDNKLNLCGFYTGMGNADAKTLAEYYGLKYGEWSTEGDPVYKIHLSLKGIRRVTKGGNTFDELAQAVANRVGSLTQNWETKDYSLKTIDGISVTMSESSGLSMFDTDAKSSAERKTRLEREAAERKTRLEREAAERKAREEHEAAERKAREEREAAERKAKEEVRRVALDWKGKSKNIPISDSVSIKLRSIPGNLWFGQYEVTQTQWGGNHGGESLPFQRREQSRRKCVLGRLPRIPFSSDSIPVVKDSGLTFRLPTDAEWEYACRAGSTGKFCQLANGTEITESTLGQVAWFEDNADSKTHSVGQKKPNAFGLYDMHGNVWEWTSTADGGDRVNRGGGYFHSASFCEFSSRLCYSPSDRDNDLGFRLCADGINKGDRTNGIHKESERRSQEEEGVAERKTQRKRRLRNGKLRMSGTLNSRRLES